MRIILPCPTKYLMQIWNSCKGMHQPAVFIQWDANGIDIPRLYGVDGRLIYGSIKNSIVLNAHKLCTRSVYPLFGQILPEVQPQQTARLTGNASAFDILHETRTINRIGLPWSVVSLVPLIFTPSTTVEGVRQEPRGKLEDAIKRTRMATHITTELIVVICPDAIT